MPFTDEEVPPVHAPPGTKLHARRQQEEQQHDHQQEGHQQQQEEQERRTYSITASLLPLFPFRSRLAAAGTQMSTCRQSSSPTMVVLP